MARFLRFLRVTRVIPVWRALVVAGALGLVVAALPALPRVTAGNSAANPAALPSARFGPPPGRGDGPGGRVGRPPDLALRPAPRAGVIPGGAPEEALELLSALALAGGAGGLLLATRDGRQSSPAAQDVASLRDEVERLRREQQHLQAAVAWQERLLAMGDRAEPAASQPTPE